MPVQNFNIAQLLNTFGQEQPATISTTTEAISSPEQMDYEKMVQRLLKEMEPSERELEIQKRIAYTPSQRAQDKVRELLGTRREVKDSQGNVTQKADPKWKKFLNFTLEAINAGTSGLTGKKYETPRERAIEQSLKDYQTEISGLNRELAVEAANKRALASQIMSGWGKDIQQKKNTTDAAYKSGILGVRNRMATDAENRTQILGGEAESRSGLRTAQADMMKKRADEIDAKMRYASAGWGPWGPKDDEQLSAFLTQLKQSDPEKAKQMEETYKRVQSAQRLNKFPPILFRESSKVTTPEGLPALMDRGGTYRDPTTKAPMQLSAPGEANATTMFPALTSAQKGVADTAGAAYKVGKETMTQIDTIAKQGGFKFDSLIARMSPDLAVATNKNKEFQKLIGKLDSVSKLIQMGVHGTRNDSAAQAIKRSIISSLIAGPEQAKALLSGYLDSARSKLRGIPGVEPYLKHQGIEPNEVLSTGGSVKMTKDGKTFAIPADKVADAEKDGFKRVP